MNAHSLDGNSHGIDTRSHTYGESEPAVGLRESPDESKGQTKDEAVEEEDEEDDEEEERSSSVIYEEVGAFVNEQLVRTNLSNDLEISEGDVIRGQREIMKRLSEEDGQFFEREMRRLSKKDGKSLGVNGLDFLGDCDSSNLGGPRCTDPFSSHEKSP